MHQELATWMMLLLLVIGQSSNELPKGAGEKATLITICEIYTAQEPGIRTCGVPATGFPGADHLRAGTLSVVPERISLTQGESYPLGNIMIVLCDSAGEVVHSPPLRLQLEDHEPEIISLSDLKSEKHVLTAIRTGKSRLKLTSLIPRPDGTYPEARLSFSVEPKECISP